MVSMRKIPWDEIFQNTTFFFIDSQIEAFYENEITKRVDEIAEKLKILSEENGIKRFIKEDKESLNILITILGISGERFKRVVSMIRADYGYIFDNEWDYKTNMQKKILENPQILDDVCELFKCGYVSPKFTSRIPHVILQKFHIDETTLNRIKNKEYLKELVQNKLDVDYFTKYKDAYHHLILQNIKPIADKFGLDIIQDSIPEGCDQPVLFMLQAVTKKIVINASYNLTTGQGQTNYQKKVTKIYKSLRDNDNYLVINILDGAGWIARNADCKQIYYNCHYFLNLKKINQIEQIICEFYNIR